MKLFTLTSEAFVFLFASVQSGVCDVMMCFSACRSHQDSLIFKDGVISHLKKKWII